MFQARAWLLGRQRGVFVKPVSTTLPELGERYIEYAKLHKRSWKRDVQMLGHLQEFSAPRNCGTSPHSGSRNTNGSGSGK